MGRYRLLAGQLVQKDKTKPKVDDNGEPTGRFATKTTTATKDTQPIVESDDDLIALFGPYKFAPADDMASARDRIASLEAELARLRAREQTIAHAGQPVQQAVFPGGQVSSGFQSPDQLEALSDADLRALAEEEEIDLRGNTREEKIAEIRRQRRAPQQPQVSAAETHRSQPGKEPLKVPPKKT